MKLFHTDIRIFAITAVLHHSSAANASPRKQNLPTTDIQPFYGSLDFVLDNPGELVQEETFTYSHQSWSSIILYLHPPSTMIHGILSVQFTCLTVFFPISLQVFFGLSLGLTPATSYSILFLTIFHNQYLAMHC